MSPAIVGAGRVCKAVSIRNALSSSMRPGSGAIWRRFAPRGHGLCAPGVFDGSSNGACFRAYFEQILLPALKPGDTVIMDNLGSHKSKAVRTALRNIGAKLRFLPKYSPDLTRSNRPWQSSSTGSASRGAEAAATSGPSSVHSSTPSSPTNVPIPS